MTAVRTRDEAIATVDVALQKWATEMTGVMVQAQTATSAASDQANRVVQRCANQVAAIQSLLASARDEQRAELQAQLARAQDAKQKADRARQRILDVDARVATLSRTLNRATSSQVPEARVKLRTMTSALDGYRAAGVAVGGGPASGSSSAVAARGGHAGSALASLGLTELAVGAADLDENPILDDGQATGMFGKGGLKRADYRWAVQTWNDVVGPGVANGQSREAFALRDAQSDAVPLRRTADVYDMFLGSERIRVDRRSDGSLNIINGRHRFQIAQELGIKSLPGQVSD